MTLRDIMAGIESTFTIDSCTCQSCVALRPQVHRIREYFKTRHVDAELMHAITDSALKQALIEEICLHAVNAKEESD